MESFYTIVFCQIRAVADEKVSVGLLLRSENMVWFRYSHDKLSVIKALLPDPAYRLLRANLKNMENYFSAYLERRTSRDLKASLFDGEPDSALTPPQFTEASYISYLNTYSSNLLTFSKPFLLNTHPIDNNTFDRLYHQFVYESDHVLENGITIYDRVKKKVNPAIRSHVNLEIELTSENISNLVLPTRVWFIGQNKVDVTGEIFDFEKRTYFLDNEISKYLHLVHALQGQPKGKSGKYFLVGKEPSKQFKENHTIWDNIRKLRYFTFVPLGELEKINEYIIEHEVAPFVQIDGNEVREEDPF
jgi:hypothetical protein